MGRLRQLVAEIHRRSLWQVLGIYVAGSWLALQVVETLSETVGLPEWFGPVAFALLIVCLPIVMATAFVQEGALAASPVPGTEGSRRAAPKADATTSDSTLPADGPTPAAPVPGPSRSTAHRIFRWRHAAAVGVGGFALLGLTAAGYMGSRLLGIGPWATLTATGALGERPEVLVADFESAEDPELGAAISQGLRMDLGGSSALVVTSPAAAARTLERMGRSTRERLAGRLASEVAVRVGAEAVLQGALHRVGGGYQLVAELVSPESGEVLASFKETAADSTRLLSAADELSASVRARVGENLATVRRSPPLPRVTTSSLEALRRYAVARRLGAEGKQEEAVAHLEAAVALDSGFAAAYRTMAANLYNLGRSPSRRLEILNAAYRHRDRLGPRERAHVAYFYHWAHNRGDSAVATLKRHNEAYPDLPVLNNLAVGLELFDRYDEAIAVYQHALSRGASNNVYGNLASALYRADRRGEWKQAMAEWEARLPDSRTRREHLARVAAAEGRWAEAERRFEEHEKQFGSDQAFDRAYIAAARGRIGEATALLSSALETSASADRAREAIEAGTYIGLLSLVTGDTTAAVAFVDSVLRRTGFPDDLDPMNRPYETLAFFRVLAGQTVRARALLTEARREMRERDVELPRRWFMVQARVAAADGDHAAAEGFLARAQQTPVCCVRSWLSKRAGLELVRGQVYATAGLRDSALAAYQRYLEPHRLSQRLRLDAFFRGGVFERLAQVHEERGDLEGAARYYAQLVELWEDADPELQPRVRAARERLEEILAERG